MLTEKITSKRAPKVRYGNDAIVLLIEENETPEAKWSKRSGLHPFTAFSNMCSFTAYLGSEERCLAED